MICMSIDNRLKQIREDKIGYQDMMDKSESLSDIFDYNEKIKELEREEKEILEDVVK